MKRLSHTLILLPAVLILITACGSEPQETSDPEVEEETSATTPADSQPNRVQTLIASELRVCLAPNMDPVSFKTDDGTWAGHDVAYLDDFADSLLLRLTPIEQSEFEGIWRKPSEGLCDIAASGIVETAERVAESGNSIWTRVYYAGDLAEIGPESFSFVVRPGAQALAFTLDHYIRAHPGFYGLEQ